MDIGRRLRQLRKERNLSQREVEARSGLSRCYISRVEGGHTVPHLVTLEKWAEALEVDLHWLFRVGPGLPASPRKEPNTSLDDRARKLAHLIGRIVPRDRTLLWSLARELARARARRN